MYERRLRSVAATITKTLSATAGGGADGAAAAAAAAAGSGTGGPLDGSSAPVRVARIIDAALSNDREEEILRLQEELAAKETEVTRLQS